jgi:bifunctional DNA-binding transcriptional regulator/antitoxin component of YhaV-PrlF toxin-antitoxin module
MAEQRFTATLQDSGRGGGRWLEVPFDPREAFGEARAPVAGTLNGTPFRGRLSVYGGKTYLGLNKEVRDAAGIDVGDSVDVVVELDDAPREVEIPNALLVAFERDAAAKAAFEKMAFTHRKEYARWIAEAKKEETRERRVAKALEMLKAGEKLS